MRGRLLVLVLLSVVPEIWLSFNDAIEERRLALLDLQHEARRFVEHAAVRQRQMVSAAEQLLRTIAAEPQAASPSSSAASCHATLSRLLEIHPQYVNLHVLRADGALVCSAVPPKRTFDVASEGYLREAVASGRFTISDYELSHVRDVGEVVFALPVPGPSGRVERVITAALDVSWLGRLWAQAGLPPGSVLIVADRNGVLLARYPDPGGWTGTSAYKDDPGFARVIAADRSIDAEVVSLDGVRRQFSFQPVRGARTALYVGAGIPVEAVEREAQAKFLRKLLLSGAGALLAFGLAWWGMRRFVLRPLDALGGAAMRIAAGDPGARAGTLGDGGEFGHVAQAFDRMAEGIERRERALRTLSASNHALIRSQSEPELMRDICRAAVEQGGYRMAWVGWAEDDERKSIRPLASAGDDASFLSAVEITWADEARGRGTSGEALRGGVIQVVNDIAAEPRMAPWREAMASRGYAAVVSLPMRLEERAAGVLTIYAAQPHAFTPEALTLLGELGDDLSFGLSALRIRQREKEAGEALRRIAYYDAVTGLPNRAWLRQRIEEEIAEARRERRSLALLLLSVDSYAEVTNALGLREGEQLLRGMVPRFERVAGEAGGMLARVQAAEFALLLPAADAARAVGAGRKLLLAMEEPVENNGSAIYVQGSVGMSFFPGSADSAALLLRRAGVALEHARRTGTGHTVYEAAMDQGAPERLAMAAELKHAIENQELLVYCQPKVLLATRRVNGAEALVRWRHPTKGLVSPAAFIPLAERTGLIKPLTYWVLGAACRQVRAWREAGLALPLAVNLSVRNLRDPQLVDTIAGLFATWGVERGQIELEITESTLMEDPAGAQETISRLHAMGIPLYIDDFGTGYSSLAYLERLPVDTIKVDQSFIAGMAKSEGAAKIVRSTIDLAHNLGMTVVAEGVETAEALERLAALGCDGAQGYHIARPMPAGELAAWLAGSPWR